MGELDRHEDVGLAPRCAPKTTSAEFEAWLKRRDEMTEAEWEEQKRRDRRAYLVSTIRSLQESDLPSKVLKDNLEAAIGSLRRLDDDYEQLLRDEVEEALKAKREEERLEKERKEREEREAREREERVEKARKALKEAEQRRWEAEKALAALAINEMPLPLEDDGVRRFKL